MQEKTPGKGDSQVQSYGRGKRAREVFIEVDGDYPFVLSILQIVRTVHLGLLL